MVLYFYTFKRKNYEPKVTTNCSNCELINFSPKLFSLSRSVCLGPRGECISVGYGLEPYVPDAIAKRIIENEMIPAFKNNDYYSGVNDAIDIIIGLASGAFTAEEYSDEDAEIFILVFFIVMMVVMIVFITFAGKVGKTSVVGRCYFEIGR